MADFVPRLSTEDPSLSTDSGPPVDTEPWPDLPVSEVIHSSDPPLLPLLSQSQSQLPPTGSPDGDVRVWAESYVKHVLITRMQTLVGRRSWDLLREVYMPAWDEVEQTRGRIDDLIALTVSFVETVSGEKLDRRARAMVAKTVRRFGKVALVGWDKAICATEDDTDRSRLAYATGTINRVLAEMQESA